MLSEMSVRDYLSTFGAVFHAAHYVALTRVPNGFGDTGSARHLPFLGRLCLGSTRDIRSFPDQALSAVAPTASESTSPIIGR
jgi:hypothetical protein